MTKILMMLAIFSAGAGGFLASRQSTAQRQQEANAACADWLGKTQLVAAAESEQTRLMERVQELKQTLAQTSVVGMNGLWSALQTNRADRLPPELRERLLDELGLNWRSSEHFIVVSKETVRSIGMQVIRGSKLTDMGVAVLAVTPEERGQVEAAIERVRTDFRDWLAVHLQRRDPQDDVLADYELAADAAMVHSISNTFHTALAQGLGRERAELIVTASQTRLWLGSLGIVEESWRFTVKREMVEGQPRLKVELRGNKSTFSNYLPLQNNYLPGALRQIFPNGWADLAEREGFELPAEYEKRGVSQP
jgi:hypothetical protein